MYLDGDLPEEAIEQEMRLAVSCCLLSFPLVLGWAGLAWAGRRACSELARPPAARCLPAKRSQHAGAPRRPLFPDSRSTPVCLLLPPSGQSLARQSVARVGCPPVRWRLRTLALTILLA